jgi:hypothetical protein
MCCVFPNETVTCTHIITTPQSRWQTVDPAQPNSDQRVHAYFLRRVSPDDATIQKAHAELEMVARATDAAAVPLLGERLTAETYRDQVCLGGYGASLPRVPQTSAAPVDDRTHLSEEMSAVFRADCCRYELERSWFQVAIQFCSHTHATVCEAERFCGHARQKAVVPHLAGRSLRQLSPEMCCRGSQNTNPPICARSRVNFYLLGGTPLKWIYPAVRW